MDEIKVAFFNTMRRDLVLNTLSVVDTSGRKWATLAAVLARLLFPAIVFGDARTEH